MPANLRLPSPPVTFNARWAAEHTRAVEQNFLDTAGSTSNTNLYQYTIGQYTQQQVLPFAGTFTYVPATMGLSGKITQAGAQTITLDGTGLPVGALVTLLLVQDATGGRVTTWTTANIKYPGGVAPTLSTTANKQNILCFYWDGFFMNVVWSSVGL
jgi:hypothetical protein